MQVESRRKGEGVRERNEAAFFISSIVGVHNSGAYYGCYSFGGRQLRAAVYTRRDRQSHGDVRAPIRYCVPLAMQQAAQYTAWQRVPPEPGVYLLPWNDRRIPFPPFSASPREGQSRSRAITSAHARNSLFLPDRINHPRRDRFRSEVFIGRADFWEWFVAEGVCALPAGGGGRFTVQL